MDTLTTLYYNKYLVRIILLFQYNSLSRELSMSLSTLLDWFPVDLLPEGITQQQAVINLFKKYDLIVLGSLKEDRAIIRHKDNMGIRLESKIV